MQIATMMKSYAQNFEDVMLSRAFKSIDNGFYIDIGAQHPVFCSVSLAFYERGWRGVHLEPHDGYARLLRAERPDEEVLEVAAGEANGTLDFHQFSGTGLSTADAEIARSHERNGLVAKRRTVEVIKTSDLLDRYADRDVHWMKIDVEGHEAEVIRGWHPSAVRPWVLVIESTRPLSPQEDVARWEPIVTDLGYEFAYFDGLNRFYVHRDHGELKRHFCVPPNIFDDFVVAPPAMLKSNRRFFLGDCDDAVVLFYRDRKRDRPFRRLMTVLFLGSPLFVRGDGRPRVPIERLILRRDGRVRGLFRRLVYDSRGRVRAAFARFPVQPGAIQSTTAAK